MISSADWWSSLLAALTLLLLSARMIYLTLSYYSIDILLITDVKLKLIFGATCPRKDCAYSLAEVAKYRQQSNSK